VKARERNEIDRNLAEIAIQLPRKAQATSHATHGSTDKMVKISIGGSCQFQSPETNVIEGFIVQEETLISIFNKLVERQDGIVGLHNRVRNFWRWNDAESFHNPVGVLLAHLAYEKGAHACAGATAKRVAELKTLKTTQQKFLKVLEIVSEAIPADLSIENSKKVSQTLYKIALKNTSDLKLKISKFAFVKAVEDQIQKLSNEKIRSLACEYFNFAKKYSEKQQKVRLM